MFRLHVATIVSRMRWGGNGRGSNIFEEKEGKRKREKGKDEKEKQKLINARLHNHERARITAAKLAAERVKNAKKHRSKNWYYVAMQLCNQVARHLAPWSLSLIKNPWKRTTLILSSPQFQLIPIARIPISPILESSSTEIVISVTRETEEPVLDRGTRRYRR